MLQVQREQAHQPPASSLPDDLSEEVEDMIRHVRYSVPKKMLECNVIETRWAFQYLALPVGELMYLTRELRSRL
jgi:hypothetical protein